MERPEQALSVPMEPFLIRLNAEKLFGTFSSTNGVAGLKAIIDLIHLLNF
jgi:hypothetical protein